MPAKSLLNIRRITRAAGHSLSGLNWLVRNEAAFQQELALFALLLGVGHLAGFDLTTQFIQIGLMSLVLLVETLNTAIEKLVDRVSFDHHPLSGLVKDLGSAAVSLSFIPLAVFWIVTLIS